MKKVTPVLMAIVFCALLLAGCSISSQSRQGQPLAVYSFSGENEFISVSNGVIVLDAEEEICYGGNLETRKDKFTDNCFILKLPFILHQMVKRIF